MNKPNIFVDSWTMSKRCLCTSFRNPDAFAAAIIVPAIVMLLFSLIFGNITDVGDYNFVDFIVPGIVLQTVAQGATASAISVNNDMMKGIIDRFRSMPLFQPSVLTGHVIASMVRCIMAVAAAVIMAFIVGFRSQASTIEWAIAIGIMLLASLAITWLFIFIGLAADSPEGTSSYAMPIQFLPFLSGGFADPEQLVLPLRVFFAHQPFTPIIEAIRSLLMGTPNSSDINLAVIWCVALILIFYALSVRIYKRRAG